ncbi:hypothetical protein SOVF_093970 [Spinacia oleracea]|uniref:Transmembrane protein n=1 Tax=Spinacia oleracea TaxID=3562 RepID=A0A9R0IYV8_SPIOL|nr:uncharacterized protein LOC110797332 [Spinacia oleracea]KNA15921.1 hypothetical protein SOVF_093970 [Spinacia oleracea]
MPEIPIARSLRLLVFLSSFLLYCFTGFSDNPPNAKNDSTEGSKKTHSGGTGTKVAIICIAVATVVLFSFFLFKLWQKKKREEQYARLLKLFEEDDELEVELGLRD